MTDDRPGTYLRDGYFRVRGMSSLFAARVVTALMRTQTSAGITGGAAEIGTFEGRFFIAMGLALTQGERLFGADSFDWPDDQVEARLRANMAAHGIAAERATIWRGQSVNLTPPDILAALGGPARIIHVDADHTDHSLSADLLLAAAVVRPDGLIVLDDMLHPAYPLLILAVHRFLAARPDWRVAAVIDRESLSGAAKFVLARRETGEFVFESLRAAMPEALVAMTARFEDHEATIVSPTPALPVF